MGQRETRLLCGHCALEFIANALSNGDGPVWTRSGICQSKDVDAPDIRLDNPRRDPSVGTECLHKLESTFAVLSASAVCAKEDRGVTGRRLGTSSVAEDTLGPNIETVPGTTQADGGRAGWETDAQGQVVR